MVDACPACKWWTIWKEGNYRTFKNKYNFVEKIKMNCIFLFYFWCKERYAEEAESIIILVPKKTVQKNKLEKST